MPRPTLPAASPGCRHWRSSWRCPRPWCRRRSPPRCGSAAARSAAAGPGPCAPRAAPRRRARAPHAAHRRGRRCSRRARSAARPPAAGCTVLPRHPRCAAERAGRGPGRRCGRAAARTARHPAALPGRSPGHPRCAQVGRPGCARRPARPPAHPRPPHPAGPPPRPARHRGRIRRSAPRASPARRSGARAARCPPGRASDRASLQEIPARTPPSPCASGRQAPVPAPHRTALRPAAARTGVADCSICAHAPSRAAGGAEFSAALPHSPVSTRACTWVSPCGPLQRVHEFLQQRAAGRRGDSRARHCDPTTHLITEH